MFKWLTKADHLEKLLDIQALTDLTDFAIAMKQSKMRYDLVLNSVRSIIKECLEKDKEPERVA